MSQLGKARRLTPKQEREVRDWLLGSCNGEELEPVLGEAFEGVYLHDLDDQSIANATDGIERCEACGWWVETIEMDDKLECEDCRDEDE